MRKLYIIIISTLTVSLSAQMQDFKLMTYNLMYYKVPDANAPCSQGITAAAKDAAFKTIFKAINPSILCVNEIVAFTDNSGARSILNNVINTDGQSNFASAAFSNAQGSSIANMLFYDTTLFVLSSQFALVNNLNNQQLVRVVDFYRMYYKDPGLKLGADTNYFTLVVGHLKAGNTASDRLARERTMDAVMNHLTQNVSDKNVIFCGDMNTYSSTEGAYQKAINYSVSNERFVDPGVAGAWNNNNSFASLHTQSTHSSGSGCFSGGGLDDRFDLILHSSSISTGAEKIKYKFNSMKAIGNDGAHFNQSINAGTNGAVSQALANALYNFSDHLPVVAEYEITPSGIGLNEVSAKDALHINNPFGNELLLSSKRVSATPLTIFICDITGKPVHSSLMNGSEQQLSINTSSWNKGIYLIKISDKKGGMVTKKIVK
jgi:exonuclease III